MKITTENHSKQKMSSVRVRLIQTVICFNKFPCSKSLFQVAYTAKNPIANSRRKAKAKHKNESIEQHRTTKSIVKEINRTNECIGWFDTFDRTFFPLLCDSLASPFRQQLRCL